MISLSPRSVLLAMQEAALINTPISDQRELSKQKKHKKTQATPQHQSTRENDMEESLTQISEERVENRMRSA